MLLLSPRTCLAPIGSVCEPQKAAVFVLIQSGVFGLTKSSSRKGHEKDWLLLGGSLGVGGGSLRSNLKAGWAGTLGKLVGFRFIKWLPGEEAPLLGWGGPSTFIKMASSSSALCSQLCSQRPKQCGYAVGTQ